MGLQIKTSSKEQTSEIRDQEHDGSRWNEIELFSCVRKCQRKESKDRKNNLSYERWLNFLPLLPREGLCFASLEGQCSERQKCTPGSELLEVDFLPSDTKASQLGPKDGWSVSSRGEGEEGDSAIFSWKARRNRGRDREHRRTRLIFWLPQRPTTTSIPEMDTVGSFLETWKCRKVFCCVPFLQSSRTIQFRHSLTSFVFATLRH